MRLANTNVPNNIIIDIAESSVIVCARVAWMAYLIRKRFIDELITNICICASQKRMSDKI